VARSRSAAERLGEVRRRTLDLLLIASLVAGLLTNLVYGHGSWQARNFPFLVVSVGELLSYAVLLGFRTLPFRVRAWGFCLVWVVIFAFYLPRGVFGVPLVNAVVSAIYAALLIGPRAGAAFILGILGLMVASALLPPEVLAALSYGPPHPPRAEPPLIVAAGLVRLLAAPVGIAIVVRGLLQGFAESQASEGRFRGIIEASPDAIALSSWPEIRIRDVNPAFTRLFGWAPEDAVGRSPSDMGILREQDLRLLIGRLEGEKQIEAIETVARRRDGAFVSLQLALRRTEIGGEEVIVAVGREVTPQRRLEATVRHAQRVEAMGTLAGGIAHNFRNALGSILPNLDYCLESAPAELHDALQDARSAARASVDLATRLTRMAHQDPGARLGPVELRSVLADVVGICRGTFGARVAIHEELDAEGLAFADRGDLHQVFLNLCLNAKDAVAEVSAPGIAVNLSRSTDGTRFVVTVADNGHGMDAETLRRVGEPFFTTKPEGRGTGLGLSTAFAAVREMGGRISVESRQRAGTTFTVEIPVHVGQVTPAEAPSVRPIRRDLRVLVVDDDPLLLEAVTRQLASLGLETEPYTDAAAAVVRVRTTRRPFDLVITDLDMPGLSGRELAAEVRAVKPEMPIVVLSAAPNENPIAGAAASLTKPASTADLASAVARCLGLETADAA
jgi:PAS domain S-box-containing protein